MQIFRFILRKKGALLAVFLLLAGIAACNLALPAYTSNIVDVGIQQSGVERVTCLVMTDSTHARFLQMLHGEDLRIFESSYDRDGDIWRLNDEGEGHFDDLDRMLALPLIQIHEGASEGSLSSDDLLEGISGNDYSLVRQRAISASIAEMESGGYDLSGLRMGYLLRVGAAMLLLALASMFLDIVLSFVASRTGASIARELRSGLFERVVSFSEMDIGKFSAASLITRGTNDIQLIQNVSIMLMRMVLYAPVMAIGGIVMVIATSPQLGWIVVVAVILVFCIAGALFALTIPKFKIMQKLVDRLNMVSREILTGIPVIRAFNRQHLESKRFDAASANLMRTQLFTNRAMSFMMPAMMLLMNVTSVAIVWFGGYGVQDGSLQTGDLIAFITYSMMIIMSFLILSMMAIMLPRANVAAVRVKEVLDTEPSIVDGRDAVELIRRDEPNPVKGDAQDSKAPDASSLDRSGASDPVVRDAGVQGLSVEFQDVSFCYDSGEDCEDVLRDVSFKLDPGKTMAIVGATGSGKTTVLKLVERFIEPVSGNILVDGMPIGEIRQDSLRKSIGYAPQDSYLFSGTIGTNVAYSDEGMSASRIEKALDIAQAEPLIDSKEEGVDTPVSQGGTNLSGGQRQRVSIARAIADEPRLLLLDDSFSALDYMTDSALRAELKQELSGASCIIVAQRIATVMDADSIIVLEDGRVVGQGTHKGLMQNCEQYRQIALSQLSEEELLGFEAGDSR